METQSTGSVRPHSPTPPIEVPCDIMAASRSNLGSAPRAARLVRLHTAAPLAEGQPVALLPDQVHRLHAVMRLAAGAEIRLFNTVDGEWRCRLSQLTKRAGEATPEHQLRSQAEEPAPGPWLAFAPLKKDAQDYLTEKAVELGVDQFWPVFTDHANSGRIRLDRLQAQAIEAAEQCERLSLPTLREPLDGLETLLAAWPSDRPILAATERQDVVPIGAYLSGLTPEALFGPLGIVIGPEGGFSPKELDVLQSHPLVTRVGLGPRILRAETAAAAALVSVQFWRDSVRPSQ